MRNDSAKPHGRVALSQQRGTRALRACPMAPMATLVTQGELFGFAQPLPTGLVYRPDFVAAEEETALLAAIEALPLKEAQSLNAGGATA